MFTKLFKVEKKVKTILMPDKQIRVDVSLKILINEKFCHISCNNV